MQTVASGEQRYIRYRRTTFRIFAVVIPAIELLAYAARCCKVDKQLLGTTSTRVGYSNVDVVMNVGLYVLTTSAGIGAHFCVMLMNH